MYLQTDDRDDYLSRFNKVQKPKIKTYDLINLNGKTLLTNVSYKVVRRYYEKTYNKNGNHIWKRELIAKGYKVLPNLIK
jgi:ABC-type sulfate transport system substrate-binding protein